MGLRDCGDPRGVLVALMARSAEERRVQRCEYARRYREKHPDRVKACLQSWYARNRTKVRADGDRWRAENPEKLREQSLRRYASRPDRVGEINKKWKALNPEKVQEQDRRRKARIKGATVDGSVAAYWPALLRAYGGRCAYCAAPGKMTLDHVVPIALGGGHTATNVVPACAPCNLKKGTKLILPKPWASMEFQGLK